VKKNKKTSIFDTLSGIKIMLREELVSFEYRKRLERETKTIRHNYVYWVVAKAMLDF
jgi:hypothetical protein